MARTDGYAAIAALPAGERSLVAIPSTLTGGAYRNRFADFMSGDPETVAALYRSQQTWDATMARSIAEGLDAGSDKVIHLVGSFHSDWDGGLVDQLRRLKPFARILTVTVVPEDARALADGDRNRADAVVYAAKPERKEEPAPPETASETAPEPAPETKPEPAEPTS
jgi:uncharacterized iron-regulated protein